MTVLLTRPRPDSERIAAKLEALGIETLIWPLSKIVGLSDKVDLPGDVEGVLFTSANAVRAFAEICPRRDLPAFCVGGRTAQTAQDAGFTDLCNANGHAADLRDLVAGSHIRHLFYPRGRETAVDLAADLRALGKMVSEAMLYGSDPAGPPESSVQRALQNGKIRALTVWSQHNAQILAEHLRDHRDWKISDTDVISISESAAVPLLESGFRRILVAARPNAAAMIASISAALRQ